MFINTELAETVCNVEICANILWAKGGHDSAQIIYLSQRIFTAVYIIKMKLLPFPLAAMLQRRNTDGMGVNTKMFGEIAIKQSAVFFSQK